MKNLPDKIYIFGEDDIMGEVLSERADGDVEYVRKDAFIKKVEEFIYSALNDGIMDTANVEDFMRLFKKYIEE